MKTEIKKINSLEELNNLEIGSKVLVANGGDMYAQERVFEGIINENYSFLQYDLKSPQNNLITAWEVRKEHIFFKPSFKGAIEIRSHSFRSYHPEEKEYQSKLNLIQGEK